VYLIHHMLFWGARNIDGRGSDNESADSAGTQVRLRPKEEERLNCLA
jgi:hypothetical protein